MPQTLKEVNHKLKKKLKIPLPCSPKNTEIVKHKHPKKLTN